MTRTKLVLLVGVLGFAALGYAAYHVLASPRYVMGKAQSAKPPMTLRAVAGRSADVPVLYFVKDPEPAPPFLVRDLSGGVVSIPQLKGKVVLLNFWATWCGPCREEIPELIALQAEYPDKLQIVGVSEDDAPPKQVEQFAKKFGINYPVIMSSSQLEDEYGGIVALPTSFLINTDGRVVQKHVGLYSFDFYNEEIEALLGQPVPAKIETFEDTGQVFLKNADRATSLPGVSLAGLTPAQKKLALKRLNTERCTCGCDLTLAQCRLTDPGCPTSLALAKKVVAEIRQGKTGPTKAALAASTNPSGN